MEEGIYRQPLTLFSTSCALPSSSWINILLTILGYIREYTTHEAKSLSILNVY